VFVTYNMITDQVFEPVCCRLACVSDVDNVRPSTPYRHIQQSLSWAAFMCRPVSVKRTRYGTRVVRRDHQRRT